MTPLDLQKEMPATYPSLIYYYQLWYDINAKRPFYLFDFVPVFAAITHMNAGEHGTKTKVCRPHIEGGTLVKWIPCVCRMNEKGTLLLEEKEEQETKKVGVAIDSDTDTHHTLYGACRDLSDECVAEYYKLLGQLKCGTQKQDD
jgi:hypothetical protein